MRTATRLIMMLCISCINAAAQPMRGADAVWDADIKSTQMRHASNPAAEPIIALKSSEQVLLSFDDLSGSHRRFLYRITLCSADWEQSNMPVSEYISGFAQDNVDNYTQSFGTLTPYTHYELLIPNDNTKVLLSGNYLVQIMDSDAPDIVLFQKGFMVSESALPMRISCSINLIPLTGRQHCEQQLDIKVDYSGMNVQDPRSDIKVRIMQNGFMPDKVHPQAVFISNAVVDYSFYDKNLYAGGAEYRQFDLSSTEYTSQRVKHLDMAEGRFHAMLEVDGIMPQHFNYDDQNGRYIVRNARYPDNSQSESDYAMTHFTLYSPQPQAGHVYIFGELTNWEIAPRYQMQYDPSGRAYHAALPLKQGIYDYRYLLVKPSGVIDLAAIEYCSAETENLYAVLVYYRSMTDRHDRLAGAAFFNTQR